ncbi:diguanylate cyclase [Halobacillus rhizosphaerae]|uniref:GGDEF domain-containing response regulator n=1 Tax=Halobacillus rhizosphaerae TaxID=3064889 RepID=UPI00398B0742
MEKNAKYQKLFFANLSKKIHEWTARNRVQEQEIYKLLHSITGTAASIGLDRMSDAANHLSKLVQEKSLVLWNQEEWTEFLQSILLYIDLDTDWPVNKELTSKTLDQQRATILILENDLGFLQFLRENLEELGYNVLMATTQDRALQLFFDQKPDYLIIDYHLNGLTGLDVMKHISSHATSILTPIMIISGDCSEALAEKVYLTHALDFVTKPINFKVLHAMIRNRLFHIQTLKKQITTDQLTNTFNRTYLYDWLNHKKREFYRSKESFSLVMLDLDNFKHVNDTYGHLIGDQVLIKLAQELKRNIRAEDSVVRYGGEEFIVLMPGISGRDAVKRMNEVLQSFKNIQHHAKGEHFRISFTCGVTEFNAEEKVEDLILQADLALYKGKRAGKGQVNQYNPELDSYLETGTEDQVHISIVDDDSIIREMLADRLEELTFAGKPVIVSTYKTGEIFLQANIPSNGKHVVLLDGVMPGMDGTEVLRDIRSRDQDTIVVMLTGRQKDADIIKALEIGADDYITKPFSLDELVARLKRIVNRHKGGVRR